MALFTAHLKMAPRKLKRGVGMVESRSRTPTRPGMTFLAVVAELLPVRIDVAGYACAAKSEKRSVWILHFDLRQCSGIYFLRVVATLTRLLAMTAFQRKPGLLGMPEALPVQRDKDIFRALMFRVALCTIPSGISVCAGMKSRVHLHSALDLIVTFQAFQSAPE